MYNIQTMKTKKCVNQIINSVDKESIAMYLLGLVFDSVKATVYVRDSLNFSCTFYNCFF